MCEAIEFSTKFFNTSSWKYVRPSNILRKNKTKNFFVCNLSAMASPQKLTAKGHGQQKQKSSSFPNAKKSKSDTNSFAMQKCLDYCSWFLKLICKPSLAVFQPPKTASNSMLIRIISEQYKMFFWKSVANLHSSERLSYKRQREEKKQGKNFSWSKKLSRLLLLTYS